MKKASALFVLILASVALVACGSSSSSSSSTAAESTASTEASGGGGSSASGETIDIETDPGGALAYTTKSITAKSGNVTIDFKNPQALMHDVAVEDSSGKEEGKTELVAEGS